MSHLMPINTGCPLFFEILIDRAWGNVYFKFLHNLRVNKASDEKKKNSFFILYIHKSTI